MELRLETADLAAARFVISPASELVWSTVALRKPKRRWLHRRWAGTASVENADLLLAMTSGATYLPDFLQPLVSPARPALSDELSAIVATPVEQAVNQVRKIDPTGPSSKQLTMFLDAPDVGLIRLAEEMEHYFRTAIAPHWSRLRAIAEADIQRRSASSAAVGLVDVLSNLHNGVQWANGLLRVPIGPQKLGPLAGRPLLLTPTCFAWPDPVPSSHLTGGFRLCYPPLGVGRLWEDRPPDARPVLDALLGKTRAKILILLAEPRTTTDLASLLGIKPPTVSHHLVVLRAAGLATQHRDGRSTVTTRTFLGEQVVAACGSG